MIQTMSAYKKKQPTNLTGTLPEIMREKGWERKLDQHRIFVDWELIVDETTALHSRPLKVVKDVLWLEVENSSWMQQLQYQKIMLLDSLNEYLRISRFSDLRFSIEEKKKIAKQEETPSVRFVPPSPELVEQFEKQISFIEDEKTRDSLMRFWYLSHSCRRE